jgi:EmrB/QacA subfamily drug resistance transporter
VTTASGADELSAVASAGLAAERAQHRRGKIVLALTSVGFLLTALDFTIVNVAFRDLKADFGASAAGLLPWTLSGYSIAFAAGLLTAGRMADTFGRKRAFLVGTATFTTASMLCGLAPSPKFLIGARVVQAIGGALIVPAATALVLPEFPIARRAWVMGVIGTIGSVAAATGPGIGGVITTHLGWRWVFFVNMPFCVATLILGPRLLTESRDASAARRPDFIGAALAIGSVAVLTLAIVQGEAWGWSSATELIVFVAAIVLGIAFVSRCRRTSNPVLDLSLLQLRYVSSANIAGLLYSMGFYALFFTNVGWLQDTWAYSEQRSGLSIVPGPLMAAVTSIYAGRLSKRFGPERIAVPSCLTLGAVVLTMSLLAPEQPSELAFIFYVACTGSMIGMAIVSLSSCANAFLPAQRFAMGSALYSTGRQVGAALGIAIASALQAAASGPTGLRRSWVYCALAIAGAGTVIATGYRRPTDAQLAASVATASPIRPTG